MRNILKFSCKDLFDIKKFPNNDLAKHIKVSNAFTSQTSLSLLLHQWSNQVANI